MGFVCPDCLFPGSLQIGEVIDLPGDSRSDEISLQIIECSHCRFAGVAVYEESRRGALDAEAVDHYGYRIEPDKLAELVALIAQCPRPRVANCDCATHEVLGQADTHGRWQLAYRGNWHSGFPMRWTASAEQ